MKRIVKYSLLVAMLTLSGCGNAHQRLYKDLSMIPGGFQEIIVTGGSVYGSTALRAYNGRYVDGEFIIERLSWDFDAPFVDVHYTMKGFKPDAPVGSRMMEPGGRF